MEHLGFSGYNIVSSADTDVYFLLPNVDGLYSVALANTSNTLLSKS